MSARLTICLLLLGASLPVMARDARVDAVADAPGIPAATRTEPVLDAAAGRRAPAASASEAPALSGGGGEAETTVRGPRWHSFLPGMFR